MESYNNKRRCSHRLRMIVLPGCAVAFFFLGWLAADRADSKACGIREGNVNPTLYLALSALEALSHGQTNESVQIILSPNYVSALSKETLKHALRPDSESRRRLATMLVRDVFENAIPDLMGNPLCCQQLDKEEIKGFVAVLCKQDLIRGMAADEYFESPEFVHLHDAYFMYMEMSVLKHLIPDCDIREYEERIKKSMDQFTNDESEVL